jgi:hypothetical protein
VYRSAGDVLFSNMTTNAFDTLPSVYMYRRSIELFLKAIATQAGPIGQQMEISLETGQHRPLPDGRLPFELNN